MMRVVNAPTAPDDADNGVPCVVLVVPAPDDTDSELPCLFPVLTDDEDD